MRNFKSLLLPILIVNVIIGLSSCKISNSSIETLLHQIDSLNSRIAKESTELKDKSTNNPYQYAPFWSLAEWINQENMNFNAHLDSLLNVDVIDSLDCQKITNDLKRIMIIYKNHTSEKDLSESLNFSRLDEALKLSNQTNLINDKQNRNLLTLKYEVMIFHLNYIEYLNTKEISFD